MRVAVSKDVPNRTYRSWPGVSKSDLDHFRKSPAHYVEAMTNPKPATPAMTLGSLVHLLVFQPDEYDKQFVIPPKLDKRKPENKLAFQEFAKANAGKTFIDQEDLDKAQAVSKAVREHKTARRLIDSASAYELSVMVDDEYGTRRKSRFDAASSEVLRIHNYDVYKPIIDLKTTDDARDFEFSKSIFNYRYHVQGAIYIDNARLAELEHNDFVLIAVEKEPPYAIQVFVLDAPSLELGRAEYNEQLRLFRECKEYDSWPSYQDGVKPLGVPSWAFKRSIDTTN
jgi:hypothetical protein